MMDILTLIGLVCKRSQKERFFYPYFVALRLLAFFFNNSEEIFVSRIITKTNYFRPTPSYFKLMQKQRYGMITMWVRKSSSLSKHKP